MTRSLLALAIALTPVLAPLRIGGVGARPAPPKADFDPYHQGVFFAVLEGLYRDGVSTAAARAIAETDPVSGYPISFVQGCPICMPALDAFRLYIVRPPFESKLPADTFGPGLPGQVEARLTGGDPASRRAELRIVVEGWVDAWLDRQRLGPRERETWNHGLADRAKQGMNILAGLRELGSGPYAYVKECPLCVGAEAGAARD
jgi:hypothetical protein